MSVWITAIILGMVQGLTEFLPISSSGHLVLLQTFLPVEGDDLAFDLVLHLGTLIPVLVLFRADLLRMLRDPLEGGGPMLERPGVRWLMLVGIASVPTALMGVLLEDLFETMFSGLYALAWQFAVTAIVLQMTGRASQGERQIGELRARDALLIGIAQGIAILPAISRSGSTIAAAMLLGVNRDLAGRFSFVISIPAILGACLLKARKVEIAPEMVGPWLVGGAVSLVFGWLSLTVLMRVIRAGRFDRFGWYCWGLAAISLILGILRG